MSSTQFLATEHPFEKWANFPHEREKFLSLLEKKNGLVPVLVLSGDRHHGEISELRLKSGRRIFDITSSSINRASRLKTPDQNRLRRGQAILGLNFGEIEFDWNRGEVRAGLLDHDGKWIESIHLNLRKHRNRI